MFLAADILSCNFVFTRFHFFVDTAMFGLFKTLINLIGCLVKQSC